MVVVEEGRVCTEQLDLYQVDGIVAEPAGALAIAALDDIAPDVAGRTVVCVLSGGNNDVARYDEIIERSLVHQGLKHYFVVDFPQRPGALRQFLDDCLGPTDDIVLFEYIKKNDREYGPGPGGRGARRAQPTSRRCSSASPGPVSTSSCCRPTARCSASLV